MQQLLKTISLRILQLILLSVIVIPVGIAAYKIIAWANEHNHEIVMDPEQDDWEYQEQNRP